MQFDSEIELFMRLQNDAHKETVFEQGHDQIPRAGLYERYDPLILKIYGG